MAMAVSEGFSAPMLGRTLVPKLFLCASTSLYALFTNTRGVKRP
jgi:hypothetical protein